MFSRVMRVLSICRLYIYIYINIPFIFAQIPENTEVYVVTLTSVTGGGSVNPTVSGPQINPLSNSTTVTIRANDAAVRFEQVTN